MGKTKQGITLEEYRNQYNYAPYELHEFAGAAKDIIDCSPLSEVAENFLETRELFKELLLEYDIEVG